MSKCGRVLSPWTVVSAFITASVLSAQHAAFHLTSPTWRLIAKFCTVATTTNKSTCSCARPTLKFLKEKKSEAAFRVKGGAASGPSVAMATVKDPCRRCGKTIYDSERMRIGAEGSDGKPCYFHKACFRCEICDISLDLTNVAPERERIFCRNHYEQMHVQLRKTDDEIAKNVRPDQTFKPKPGAAGGPAVRIATKRDACSKCGKTVYAEEMMRSGTSRADGDPAVYHKACFRCTTCNASLDLGTVAPDREILYCKQHYGEIHVQLRRTDEEIAKGVSKAEDFKPKPGAASGPAISMESKSPNCTKCGKTVYPADLMRSGATDEKGHPCFYHKACFKCETCGSSLELSNVAPDGKLVYCQQHYREIHVSRHDQTGALAASKPAAASS